MRYLLLLLLPFLVGWPSVNLGGGVPAAGGGGTWGDSCTSASGTVFCMNFGTGSDGCTDTWGGGSDACTSAPSNMDPDCASGTDACPLDDGESLLQTADSSVQARFQSVITALSGTDILRCRMNFMWTVDGTGTASFDFLRFYIGGAAQNVSLNIDYDDTDAGGDQVFCVESGSAGEVCGSTDAFDVDVAQEVCLEYDYANDDIDVYLNGDCSGSPHATDNGGASKAVDGWRFLAGGTTDRYIVDNFMCETIP